MLLKSTGMHMNYEYVRRETSWTGDLQLMYETYEIHFLLTAPQHDNNTICITYMQI